MWRRTGFITFILIFNLLQANKALRAGGSQTVLFLSADTLQTREEFIRVVKTDRWLAPDKGKHFMASLYTTVLMAKLSENIFGTDKNQASGIAPG